MKDHSLTATQAQYPSIELALNKGITLEIEVSQLDQVRKVFKWGRRYFKRLKEDNTDWARSKKLMPDTLILQVAPEGGPRTLLWQNAEIELEEEEKEIDGLVLTEFKTQVQALFFLESDRLFAKVEEDYLALDGNDEIKAFVAQRQEKSPVEIGADFFAWREVFKKANEGTKEREFTQDEGLLALVPNGKPDRDFNRALMKHPNWGLNENLFCRFHDGLEGSIVTYQPPEIVDLGGDPDQALTALDRRFSEIKSELVGDVIDVLFHHWKMHKSDRTSWVPIDAATLCKYRNKVPEGDNLQLHWHALRDALNSFSLQVGDVKAKLFFSESKGENRDGANARYLYSPGFMLQSALEGQPLYFAPCLQKVWALDPARNNEAKRLARYLRGDWRMNTEKYLESESGEARAARWHSWAYLLEECGIDVEAHKEGKNPKRLIEAIERAVETLYDNEVIAEGGFHIYHPEDRLSAQKLPRRGALNVWLGLRVCLAPSTKLREALLITDGKRRAGKERDAKALATERAKTKVRAERAKSQKNKA